MYELQTHVAALEKELAVWRTGESVPESEWVLGLPGMYVKPVGGMVTALSNETLPESTSDEKEEFLKRENELAIVQQRLPIHAPRLPRWLQPYWLP